MSSITETVSVPIENTLTAPKNTKKATKKTDVKPISETEVKPVAETPAKKTKKTVKPTVSSSLPTTDNVVGDKNNGSTTTPSIPTTDEAINTATPTNDDKGTVTSKTRTRKPVLPAKFKRHQVFAFWLVSKLVNDGIILPDKTFDIFTNLNIFSSIDEQKLFYQSFIDISKQAQKDLTVLQKNGGKPTSNNNTKKSKSKPKLISNIINQPSSIDNILSQIDNIIDNNHTNTVNISNIHVNDHNHNDDDDEISTSILHINGKNYLIDELNNVYDFHSHLHIGSLINHDLILI